MANIYKPITQVQLVSGGNVVKQGHDFTLEFDLFDSEGGLVDLSGGSVQVLIAGKAGNVFIGTAAIQSQRGRIRFSVDESLPAEDLKVEFTIIRGDNTQKFPADGWVMLRVTPSISDLEYSPPTTVTIEMLTGAALEAAGFANEQGERAKAEADRLEGTDVSVLNTKIDEVDTRVTQQLAENVQEIDEAKVILPIKSNLLRRVWQKVKFPSGFNWQDAPITIYKNRVGEFKTNFDVSTFAPIGKVYYVDALNGDDNNNGLTPQTAFQRVYKAYVAPESNIEIRVAEGVYTRDHLVQVSHPLVNKNVSIKPINPGDKVVFSAHDGLERLTWVLHSGSTYKATRSAVSRIFDAKFMDGEGDYNELAKRNSISEVEANAGSFFIDNNSVIYVRLLDSRAPDSNLRPYFNNLSVIKFIGNYKLYLEGIDIEGGMNTLWVEGNSSSEGSNPKVYAKECTFKYSSSLLHDCLDIDGADFAFFQSCIVAKGWKDGFGYHKDDGSAIKAIEVNCTGRHNGSSDNSTMTDNGSTQHNGGKVIRVNGNYYGNRGSNIGDTHIGTQSLNYGCASYDSSAPVDHIYNSNYSAHAGSEMWIDSSVSLDSLNAILAQDNAKAHVRDFIYEGKEVTEGTGEILPY